MKMHPQTWEAFFMNQNSEHWNKQILQAFNRKAAEQALKRVNQVELKKKEKRETYEFKQKRLI